MTDVGKEEIVHCDECKKMEMSEVHCTGGRVLIIPYCEYHKMYVKGYNFCSWGIKEKEEN